MRRTIAVAVALAMACAVAMAAPEPLVLFDFEGTDTASMSSNVAVSTEQAKTGKASGKWANHPTASSLSSNDIPHDWSAFDTLSFWLYSVVANDAEFMMTLGSENDSTEGSDYYNKEIVVNWTGWKHFEFPFSALGKARKPIGPNKIDNLRFSASGWSNEPKEDTVIYIDDVKLIHYGARLRNASFDDDADGDGVPDAWSFSPQGKGADAQASLVDEGRTGKCVKIVDQLKDQGVGVQQRVPVTAGKTYKLSAWKKGDSLAFYLNFYGKDGKRIEPEHNKGMKNKNPEEWEQFEFSVQAPEDAGSVSAWFYSYSSNLGTFYIDDANLEEVE